MGTAFLVAMAVAAVALATFGPAARGTEIALQLTARWSFLLFWLAYVGGAAARVFGRRFDGLARRGRELGLAFASAQLVHVALILWLIYIATGPGGSMVFFWVGIFCTYLLAFLSLPQLQNALGPLAWRLLRTVSVEYIALVFAVDFIMLPFEEHGILNYPASYAPFGFTLIAATALRITIFVKPQGSPRRSTI